MRRPRNPESTKAAILEACLACLAAGGREGVSLLDVAELAGVNRSTVYDYYKTRENLIDETTRWISGRLFRAVFEDVGELGERPFDQIDVLALNARLVEFAMDNPELCQVWLGHVLSMADPSQDPFWREFEGAIERFARTEAAQPGVDAEVFTIALLASAFIWPTFARARTRSTKKIHESSQRFLSEWHRLALYGVARPANFPQLVGSIKAPGAGRKRQGKSSTDAE